MVARSAQQSPPCEKCGKRNEQRRALKNGTGLPANPRQAPVLARRCEFPAAFRLADTFGTTFWCQKHPPGETAGNRRSFFFPRFRKAEFVVRYRATVIIDFPHMATRELAVLPILRDEACGARIAGLRGRRLRPARRPMAP